jgi:hypothetical protein
MIAIYPPPSKQRLAHSLRFKLAGTFLVAGRPMQSLGLSGVWYHMEADRVKLGGTRPRSDCRPTMPHFLNRK